jgi:hypothetical protein
MANTDNKEKRPELVDDEPAKGGIEHANPEPHPSGDSPKRQGDPFKGELKTGK